MDAFAKEIVDGVRMIQISESDHSINTRGRSRLQAGQELLVRRGGG